MHFIEATIDLSKEKQKRKTFENKKTEEKKMREVSKEEMREVTAGKWNTLECSVAEEKDKAACHSMVDRLVDSYNRGLSTR